MERFFLSFFFARRQQPTRPRSSDPTGFSPDVTAGGSGPLFGRSWFFGMVERRYSRRHQDNSTRSDRLARSLALGIEQRWKRVRCRWALAHSKGRRRRCYKVCCCCFCRHENGELLTQWRQLNRAARARSGAHERGREGLSAVASWVTVLFSAETSLFTFALK